MMHYQLHVLIHMCCNAGVVYTSLLRALCTITFVEVVNLPNDSIGKHKTSTTPHRQIVENHVSIIV